jgi:hypothetical protein
MLEINRSSTWGLCVRGRNRWRSCRPDVKGDIGGEVRGHMLGKRQIEKFEARCQERDRC